MSGTAGFRLVSMLVVMSALAVAQSEKQRPDFNDYPARHVYRGKPAPPTLNKYYRGFRTAIRGGANRPVQFAGHYTVPGWGCGAGCVHFVLVDAITGKLYDGFTVVLPLDWLDEHPEIDLKPVEYQPNSRLLRINGCLGEDGPCGFYDYVMNPAKGLKLIREELLPEKYQPRPSTGDKS